MARRSVTELAMPSRLFWRPLDLAEQTDENVVVLTAMRQSNKEVAKIAGVLQPVCRRTDKAILRFMNGADVIASWRDSIESFPGWSNGFAAQQVTVRSDHGG